MNLLGLIVVMSVVFAFNATAEDAKSNFLHREVLRQLTTEHVNCAMFYLSKSICAKTDSAFAKQTRQASEIMMQQAYRLAAEAQSTHQSVTIYGKLVIDEINEQIDGDCGKLALLEEKHKMCKGLAEDFTVRGRELLQEQVEMHRK